jgi:hypothetical protein
MTNAARSAPTSRENTARRTVDAQPTGAQPKGAHAAARDRFRPEPTKRLRLNARDLKVLAFLYDNSLASRSHLQALFYGSRSYTNARLRDLFDHKIVLRHFPNVTQGGASGEEAVYAVGPAAIPVLSEHLDEPMEAVKAHVRRREAPQFVAHALRTVDIYLALRRAALSGGIEVERWVGETRARHDYDARDGSGAWRRESFKPDGFLRLRGPSGIRCFFVECDLGHVSQSGWALKVRAHRRYLESGLFKEIFGEAAFQTLAVTTGSERLRHLAETTREEGGAFFRFATFAGLRERGAFGRIWHAPEGGKAEPLLLP